MGNKYGYNGAGGGAKGGGGYGNNMQSLMKQAQQMQQQLQDVQAQLEELTFVGSSGGGLVEATVNGKKTVLSVHISEQACDPSDTEMLEDLVLAAINDAYAKAQQKEEEMMAPFAAMKGLL